ncbi:MAG: FAD-dependent oxidoreductase [Pseudorhodoplanes sp.]|nr:FAD-dependent oxidoreductase [Pseudorhodoplanes sp.]
MREGVVVIGAGQAAAQLAASLRQGGFRQPIRILGDEPYLPYQRPPLSKKFLPDPKNPDTLLLRPQTFWQDQGIAIETGRRVGAIDRANRRVLTTDGDEIGYATLVLATGTSARHLPIPGIDKPGVFSLRTIADTLRLRPALDLARRIVIIGGGYIGLEAAAVFRGEGRDVTVLEAEDRVLKRVTGAAISDFFRTLHGGRGVDLRMHARVSAIEGEPRVSGVVLADGHRLPADLVLNATGARPNDDLAKAAGIACGDGILVNELARTDDPHIYAIGDCARFHSARYGRVLRLESVQNAIDQAKAAAAAILGQPQHYDPVPWFWSDQYDIKLQIAGLADRHDAAAIVGDPASGRFSVEYRADGKLVAVDAVNDGRAHMMARRKIAEELSPSATAPAR